MEANSSPLIPKTPLGVDVLPTGSLALDVALGIGGVPRGRAVEIFGPPGCGKTTLALCILRQAQRDGYALFVDAEHGLSPRYARACGLDEHTLLLVWPPDGEAAFEILALMLRSKTISAAVVDTVAALAPRAEQFLPAGETRPELYEQMLSIGLRRISRTLPQSGAALILLNQTRSRLRRPQSGAVTTPGGMTLKLHADIRIALQPLGTVSTAPDRRGLRCQATVVKNRFAPALRAATLNFVYNEGIARAEDILDAALQIGIVDKPGTNYMLGNQTLGKGREATIETLRQNPDVLEHIETLIRRSLPPRLVSLEG